MPQVDGSERLELDGCIACRDLFQSALIRLAQARCLVDGDRLASVRMFESPTIGLAFRGGSIVHCGSQQVQSDLTRAILHSPHVEYSTTHPWGAGCRVFFLILDPALADELTPGGLAPRPPRGLVVSPALQLRARRLVTQALADSEREPLQVESEALALAADLFASAREGAVQAKRPSTQGVHDRSVTRVCALLHQHYREPLGVAQLARAANASPDHLLRLFRWQVGLSVHQYQLRLRLHAALEALSDSVADLSALAHELGFSSHSHFTAAFRAAFGAAPSTVRRDLRRLSGTHRRAMLSELRLHLPVGADDAEATRLGAAG
jgi:AraC-like DNA-binding protein